MATTKKAYYKHHQRDTDADARSSAKTREVVISTEGKKLIWKNNDGTFGELVSNYEKNAKSYSSFAAAISAIGSAITELVISEAISISGNLSIPTTMSIRMVRGGSITLNGFTLTFNGPFDAQLAQCFIGAGTVAFLSGTVRDIFPQWWGAKGNDAGLTDCGPAFQASFDCATASQRGSTVRLVGGSYRMSGTVIMRRDMAFMGDPAAYINPSEDNQVMFLCETQTSRFKFERIGFVNTNGYTGVIGIKAVGARENVQFIQLHFEGLKKGLLLKQLCWDTTISKCRATGCNIGFEATNSSHQLMFDRCTALNGVIPAVNPTFGDGSGFYLHGEPGDTATGGVSAAGSPTVTGLSSTAEFFEGGIAIFSAGFTSPTTRYTIVSKTANSLTVSGNAVSNQSGITVTSKAIEPFISKSMLLQCLSQGHAGHGILLKDTDGTQILGGYTEANALGDITADNAFYLLTEHTWGGGNGGMHHIQLRNCQGADLRHVLCPGTRTTGTFDVDASNVYCDGFLMRGTSNNLLSGDVTGLHMQENKNGTLRLGNIGHGTSGAEATMLYGVCEGLGSAFRRWHPITNNRNNKNDVQPGNVIDCRSQYDVWRKGVRGGEYFTFTNPEDGQFVYLILRGTSDMGERPNNINVAGFNINMAGAGASMNTVIGLEYDGDYGWILKSDSGWNQYEFQSVDVQGIRLRAASTAPVAGTWKRGDLAHSTNTSPTSGVHGWKCTNSGTFSAFSGTAGSVNGSPLLVGLDTTGLSVGDFVSMSASSFSPGTRAQVLGFRTNSTAVEGAGISTNLSPIITGLANTSDFFKGDFVTVSAGFASTVIPYKIIDKTSTSLTLSANATSSQTGITVQAVAGVELDNTAILTVASPGIAVTTPDPTFEVFGRTLDKNFSVTYAGAASTNAITVENTDSASASSGAKFHAKTTGDGGGNPFLHTEVPGIQGYSVGINNAVANNPFQISNASVLGTNNKISIDGSEITLINGPKIVVCTGTPEGAITAGIGSIAMRTDGGAGTSLYVKESGTGNTGWVGK